MNKSPLEILKEEHILAKDIVSLLSNVAGQLRQKKSISLIKLKELSLAVEKALENHHKKEMEVFSFLKAQKEIPRSDLIKILIREHDLGSEYIANVVRIIEKKHHEEEEKYELLPFHIEKYASLLKDHIEKEERDLFPMMEGYIGEEETKRLSGAFRNIEINPSSRKALEIIADAKKRYI